MAIPRDAPYVTPPEPEKTYDSIWLNDIKISTTQTEGRLTIKCLPYDVSNQEVNMGLEGGIEYIETRDLWKAVAEVPEVSGAMDAITNAVVPLRNWITAQNPPPPSGDPPA